MVSVKDQYDFFLLILKVLDGATSEQEFAHFEKTLQTNAELRRLYLLTIESHAVLKYSQKTCQTSTTLSCSDSITDRAIWEELVKYEQNAPAICLSAETEVKPSQPFSPATVIHNRSPLPIIALFATAAIFMILFLISQVARTRAGKEVATVSDSVNAQLADEYYTLKAGSRLSTGSRPIFLKKGFVEILFDNDAKIVVESPAEFSILTQDQVMLTHGKLYASVGPEAYGFTVSTSNSKIIDLGTEFGVNTDNYGNTDLHVLRGKTNLVSALKGEHINVKIAEGNARRLSAISGQLKNIDLDTKQFVREIDSENDVIWRGDTTIDLADIVGGGNGFGNGRQDYFINLDTGKAQPITRNDKVFAEGRRSSKGYIKIDNSAFIDGVFVPDAHKGPVYVSSKGHIFKEAPETSGCYWAGIVNGTNSLNPPLSLNGISLGTLENPALFMHSNIGITFDLSAIRRLLPGQSIAKFKSLYGISDPPKKVIEPYADFWILVDGQVRFSKTNVTMQQAGEIEIPISDSDNFLTLITTEGGKETTSWNNSLNYNDRCVFGMPVLILK